MPSFLCSHTPFLHRVLIHGLSPAHGKNKIVVTIQSHSCSPNIRTLLNEILEINSMKIEVEVKGRKITGIHITLISVSTTKNL